MKKILINSLIWLLFFAEMFYLGCTLLGVQLFLIGSGCINWWQCGLIYMPVLPIMASHCKLMDFYSKTIFKN